jgi:hypothetical protein
MVEPSSDTSDIGRSVDQRTSATEFRVASASVAAAVASIAPKGEVMTISSTMADSSVRKVDRDVKVRGGKCADAVI